jgi:predicted transcriptional regulator
MNEAETRSGLTELTVDLLSAFVSNNSTRADDLPKLIADTHAALAALAASEQSGQAEEEAPAAEEFAPAVSARKSLGSRDHILSMIDGKPYKSLKRHLGRHGLTPDQYRARYKLPASYPMVAPGYSEQRREVAKRLGLGRKRKEAPPAADGSAGAAPKRRGRRRAVES